MGKIESAISLLGWKPKDKFLILEISPEKSRALLLGVDKDRNLSLERSWDEFPLKKLNAAQIGNLSKKKVIVSVAPTLIYTRAFPIELARDSSAAPLSLVELENLLAQTIGKLFNGERKNASAHLGVDELNAILVNSRVSDFKVDGHAVLNPAGFAGKIIKAVLELSFTTRSVFYGLRNFFNAKEGFFFTGTHLAGLRFLAWMESLPANLLVVGDENSFYLTLDKAAWGNSVYSGEIEWQIKLLWKAIASSLGVSNATVARIYDSFVRRDASADFIRSFRRLIKPEIDNFLDRVKKSRLKGRVHLHSATPLPFSMPLTLGRLTFCDLPMARALEKGGFKADIAQWPFNSRDVFMRLAPFFEFYYDKSDSDINNKLRRRLHWLIQE